jgi:hypothetical protein
MATNTISTPLQLLPGLPGDQRATSGKSLDQIMGKSIKVFNP